MNIIHSILVQAHSFSSETPQSNQKSSLEIKASDTDTINSLERDLEIASKNIPQVSKRDLDEIKAFNNPPVVVKSVLEANSILFTHTAQPYSRFSKTARDFQSFDKDSIPHSVLEKLEPYIDNPELNSDRIKCVSASTVGVMEWIRSIYQYGIITHKLKQLDVNPKQKPAQQTHSKDSQSFPPLIPPAEKKSCSLNIEVSDTDTINSLERDLEIANKNIPQVSKACIVEIKAFKHPPVVVKSVLEANSILFTHTAQPYSRFSKTARDFQSFDKDNIPYSVLEKLEPYIDNPELNSDRIKRVSASTVGVMEWIRSIYQYGIITHKLKQLDVNPKQKPAQQTHSKDSQSFPPLIPPAEKKSCSLNIEVSDTDTINSLERDLEIADKNIPQVSKACIVEIKAFKHPPVVVKSVLEANSILFTHTAQPYSRFSKTARDFQSFDKDNIPYSVLEKLEPYIDNPELNSDRIKCVSASTVGVMEWIRSIYQYGIITHKLKQLDAIAKQRGITSEIVPSN